MVCNRGGHACCGPKSVKVRVRVVQITVFDLPVAVLPFMCIVELTRGQHSMSCGWPKSTYELEVTKSDVNVSWGNHLAM